LSSRPNLQKKSSIVAASMLFFIFLSFSSLATAFSSVSSSISLSPLVSVKCEATTTCNYAGYGVTAAKGAVTFVSANITLPQITCNSTQYPEQITNFIVQIDGYRGSTKDKFYAYDGVQVTCLEGKVAWSAVTGYEDPDEGGAGTVSWPTAAPGDQVSMSVKDIGGNVNFTVTDHTADLSITPTMRIPGLDKNSAGCLVAFSPGATLVNFGTSNFQNCQATLSGKTKAIGGFGSSSLVEYILYGSTGKRLLASPGSLTNNEDFTVQFLRPG